MDNETKLSKQQRETLEKMLQTNGDAPVDVDAFVKAHLTAQQAGAVQQLLKNPALIKAMLSSPQAKAMLENLRRGDGDA